MRLLLDSVGWKGVKKRCVSLLDLIFYSVEGAKTTATLVHILSFWRVLWRPRSNKPCAHCACVLDMFVSNVLLATTRLQWGNWYTNDIWQGYMELTHSQTFSCFSLFFTSISPSFSELSWQHLFRRKPPRRCFSMSLWKRWHSPSAAHANRHHPFLVHAFGFQGYCTLLQERESNNLLALEIWRKALRLLLWFGWAN